MAPISSGGVYTYGNPTAARCASVWPTWMLKDADGSRTSYRIQAQFYAVKGPELFSKWVGESEKAIETSTERHVLPVRRLFFLMKLTPLPRSEGHLALPQLEIGCFRSCLRNWTESWVVPARVANSAQQW